MGFARTIFVLLLATTYCSPAMRAVNVVAYGAKGDGENDDTDAIQAAIDYAAANGRNVVVPAGTYMLDPRTEIDDEDEGYVTKCAIIMRSRMHVEGTRGATFKIRDNASTDSSPLSMGMFCTDSILTDVSIRGLVMDMNGTNNPISPHRDDLSLDPHKRYVQWNQSHILVSGTGKANGVADPERAARISDADIEDNEFLNTPGVCAITLAQTNAPGATLGRGWTLRNNVFYNNGLDTDDHTTIFAWADDVLVEGNTFLNPVMQSGFTGGKVAYEVHGANQRFINNRVANYMRGMWIASNLTSAATNIVVANNTFSRVRLYGIDFFRESPLNGAIENVTISDNAFGFDDSRVDTDPPGVQKAAVQINATYAVRDVFIARNTASKTGSIVGSEFAVVATRSGGESHDRIRITGNSAAGFGGGVLLRSADIGLGIIEVDNNVFYDITNQGQFAAIGICSDPYLVDAYSADVAYATGARVTYVGSMYRSLQDSNANHPPDASATWWMMDEPRTKYVGLWNNTIVSGGLSEMQYGVYLNGRFDALYLGSQTITGATVAAYNVSGASTIKPAIGAAALGNADRPRLE